MAFPLKIYTWPSNEGKFGAIRKFDIHTGVDLYCKPLQPVHAVEEGTVISVENFTGPEAGSPWWNDTQAVLIRGKSGVFCYGEITTRCYIGQHINEGEHIGNVLTVLKKDKGKPMTMLHIELYRYDIKESVIWKLNKPKPQGLWDPTCILRDER